MDASDMQKAIILMQEAERTAHAFMAHAQVCDHCRESSMKSRPYMCEYGANLWDTFVTADKLAEPYVTQWKLASGQLPELDS